MPALALLAFGPPPGSALFPYTTLFRSRARRRGPRVRRADDARQRDRPRDRRARHGAGGGRRGGARLAASRRSEERRVGKECRTRWWADREKEKRKHQ